MLFCFLLAAAICVWFAIVHLSCWPDGRKCYFQLSLCCSQEFMCCLEHAGVQVFTSPAYPSQLPCLTRSRKGQRILSVPLPWKSPGQKTGYAIPCMRIDSFVTHLALWISLFWNGKGASNVMSLLNKNKNIGCLQTFGPFWFTHFS